MEKDESQILILTIDCNHKSKGGNSEYLRENSILSSDVDDNLKMEICSNRQKNFQLLKEEKIRWDNDRNELRINRELKPGCDFCFSQPDPDSKYMPAIYRYKGGFYSGLEESGKIQLLNCDHHFLILSACYGILRPLEPIQYYACQFGDRNEAYMLWTKNNFISTVLADYIIKNKICRIFDFTYCSVEAFHDCFNWDYISKKTGVEILHAYHRWNQGDDALFNFGTFLKEFMISQSSEKLLDIDCDIFYDDVIFRTIKRQDNSSFLLDEFEKNVRGFIHTLLDPKYPDFWEVYDKRDSSQTSTLSKINERIEAERKRNPFLNQFKIDKLDYCDIYTYQKIIEKFWVDFEPVLLSKPTMRKHFENIVELRNPERHVRKTNKIQTDLGKASLKWFDEIFKNQGI